MFGLTISATYKGIKDNMFEWSLTLTRGSRSYTFDYRAGFAHCSKSGKLGQPREKKTHQISRALKPLAT